MERTLTVTEWWEVRWTEAKPDYDQRQGAYTSHHERQETYYDEGGARARTRDLISKPEASGIKLAKWEEA